MILRKYKRPRLDPRKDSAYLRWIRSLPCVVCRVWGLTRFEYGRVESAHVGMRGMKQKCADTETLPLCAHHHRTGPHSHHALGRKFWFFWKLDRYALIREYQREFEGSKAA